MLRELRHDSLTTAIGITISLAAIAFLNPTQLTGNWARWPAPISPFLAIDSTSTLAPNPLPSRIATPTAPIGDEVSPPQLAGLLPNGRAAKGGMEVAIATTDALPSDSAKALVKTTLAPVAKALPGVSAQVKLLAQRGDSN